MTRLACGEKITTILTHIRYRQTLAIAGDAKLTVRTTSGRACLEPRSGTAGYRQPTNMGDDVWLTRTTECGWNWTPPSSMAWRSCPLHSNAQECWQQPHSTRPSPSSPSIRLSKRPDLKLGAQSARGGRTHCNVHRDTFAHARAGKGSKPKWDAKPATRTRADE